jgi:hypothetical protein
MEKSPTLFISYSWDNDGHKTWVKDLAAQLRRDGVDVKLDQWNVVPGDQLPAFMEKSIREIDYVLIVCTPDYKQKSDNRRGGVGYEGDIITGEIYQHQNHRKFIPVLRLGNFRDSAPSWLAGKYSVDLRADSDWERNYNDLLTTLLNTRETPPPLGKPKQKRVLAQPTSSDHTHELEDVKIKGIIVDQISEPRNDGSPGSALYKIPFELNNTPDYEWSQLFKQIWDRPPQFTTMHRPGIGYVEGNRIILDGTTIEEVKKYHRDTLKLVVDTVNKIHNEKKLNEKHRKQREEEERIKRRNDIKGVADDIGF